MKTDLPISLTHGQRIFLGNAAKRNDGACIPPRRSNRRDARTPAAVLIEHRLLREVRAKPGMPVWREDEAARPLALVVTKLGRATILAADGNAVPNMAANADANREPTDAARAGTPRPPRDGSKIAAVIALTARETGAGLTELIGATGWLPHTTRAALTGLRHRGYAIAHERDRERGTVYRIVARTEDAAGA
jgi:hypothetical protein